MPMAVCCIGSVCVDLINSCREFPIEDSDQRVLSLHWQRGGNAGNTAVTLSLLGSNPHFFGTVSKYEGNSLSWASTAARLAVEDLKRHGVDVSNIVYCPCEDFPTSSVMVNSQNGSRTILHFRGSLPELSIEDFAKLDPRLYKWIHFELRQNVDAVYKAMEMVKKFNGGQLENDRVIVSVEFEKIRKYDGDLLSLAKFADLVFIGKDFSRHRGWNSALQTVEDIKPFLSPGSDVISTWGSVGAAYATNIPSNVGVEVCARTVDNIVDTLGAGDVFLGAVIHSMLNGRSLGESVEFGCRVAERKLTAFGFDNIKGMALPK